MHLDFEEPLFQTDDGTCELVLVSVGKVVVSWLGFPVLVVLLQVCLAVEVVSADRIARGTVFALADVLLPLLVNCEAFSFSFIVRNVEIFNCHFRFSNFTGS